MPRIFHRKAHMITATKNLDYSYILFDFLNFREYHKYTYFRLNIELFGNLKKLEIDSKFYVNEIVQDGTERKPYLDLERVFPIKERADEMYEPVINNLRDNIIKIFKKDYHQDLIREDILLLDSSGPAEGGYKMSLHIIVAPANRSLYYTNSKYTDSSAFHLFTQLMLLEPEYEQYLDDQVYNGAVNFRIIGSYKKQGCDRVLRPLDSATLKPIKLDPKSRLRYLLTYMDPNLPQIKLNTPIFEIPLKTLGRAPRILENSPNKTKVSAHLLGLVCKHHPTAVDRGQSANGYYRFNYTNRREPCPISGLIHSGTNGIYVWEWNTGYLLRCSSDRCKGKKYLHIGYVNEADELIKDGEQVETRYLLEDTQVIELIDKWHDKHKVLAIKSPMDTGKTRMIQYIISEYKYERILWITHRQTLTKNLYGAFKENKFVSYMDRPGSLYDCDRVLVQIDSIKRINQINDTLDGFSYKNYDLVCIDESESHLYHYQSPFLHKDTETARDIFNFVMEIIKDSGKLLLLDADLGIRTGLLLNHLKDYILINNNYKPKPRTFVVTNDREGFYQKIWSDLRQGRNICIVSMSSTEIENFTEELDKARINYILHTSHTDDQLKNELSDVNNFWSRFQCVLYSPTIEAGVDFNVKHFDRMYCVIRDGIRTCSQRSFIQMTGRIRNLKDLTINCFYNGLNCSNPNLLADIYTYDDVIQYFSYFETLNKKRILQKEEFEKVVNGNITTMKKKIVPICLFDKISLHNEVENLNRAHDTYLTVLNKLIMRAGHTLKLNYVDPEPPEHDSDEEPITNKEKLINKLINTDHIKHSYDDLVKKQTKNQLNAEEKVALQKYRLIKLFGLKPNVSAGRLTKYLEIYIDNEIKFVRYKRLFGLEQLTERANEVDTFSDGKEKCRLKIIVNMYNLLTARNHKNMTLPEFKARTLSETAYKKGMNRIVRESIYYRNPYKYHALFFQKKFTKKKDYGNRQQRKATQADMQTIIKLFASYGIILRRGHQTQKKKKRMYTYLLSVDKQIKNIVHNKI